MKRFLVVGLLLIATAALISACDSGSSAGSGTGGNSGRGGGGGAGGCPPNGFYCYTCAPDPNIATCTPQGTWMCPPGEYSTRPICGTGGTIGTGGKSGAGGGGAAGSGAAGSSGGGGGGGRAGAGGGAGQVCGTGNPCASGKVCVSYSCGPLGVSGGCTAPAPKCIDDPCDGGTCSSCSPTTCLPFGGNCIRANPADIACVMPG